MGEPPAVTISNKIAINNRLILRIVSLLNYVIKYYVEP